MKHELTALVALAVFVFATSILSAAINDQHETACPIPVVEKWLVYRPLFERDRAEATDRRNPVWETRYDPFRPNRIGMTVSLDEVIIAKMWNIEVRGNYLIFTDVRAALFVPNLSVWKNEIQIPIFCGGWYLGKKGARLGRGDVYDILGWNKEGVALSIETESGVIVTRIIKLSSTP
ncbi:MAG: hypothetical protein HYY92_01540 [Parcubacteria group bacterium]|nr:hypothetical protein [Parcubacteria group bacterium]